MTQKIYDASAANLDGSDETFSTDISNKNKRFTVLYINDTDVEISVSAKLTRKEDIDLADAVTPNTQTIPSGERGSDVLLDDPWERIGAEVSFSAAPLSGTVKAYLITNPR